MTVLRALLKEWVKAMLNIHALTLKYTQRDFKMRLRRLIIVRTHFDKTFRDLQCRIERFKHTARMSLGNDVDG